MRRLRIIGTEISITDYQEVLDRIDSAIEDDERIYVCCAPASTLVMARDDAELRRALDSAEVVTPDGMGVVKAARLLGESIDARVYGPDLMKLQLARAEAAETPSYFYGGHDDEALGQLLNELKAEFPGLRIAGRHSPPHRPLSGLERARIVDEINTSGAEIVWVGIGSPKQEIWMNKLRDELVPPVLCGVGAAFDFHANRVRQAPKWMRDFGLEWLHRLGSDPARIGLRYRKTLPRFVALVFAQRLTSRSSTSR